jgi:hypothetical protein
VREGGKYALVEMRSKFGAREGYGLDLEGDEAMFSKAKMSEVFSCQDVEMLCCRESKSSLNRPKGKITVRVNAGGFPASSPQHCLIRLSEKLEKFSWP